MATRRVLGFLILIVLFGTLVVAQSTGRIGGQVVREDGSGVGGVVVVIAQTSAATLTDNNGNFSFSGVPAGTYAVTFTFGDQSTGAEDVVVKAGEETQIRQTVDWSISYAESLTVYSASRRQERIVEAPASISVISEQEIEREASHGQVPKLLEFTPGAEVTQSGIYDYNFNTRGFNSSLNRRVATLIDGRNASVPFLGAQEWAAVSFPLDDLASLEFVRGPSAALYGANASSGVLNLSTKSPRHSQGGTVRISGGELSTTNVDFRFANEAGAGWYYKVAGGIRNSGDFTVSRNGAAEYSVPCTMSGQTNCLPQEPLPLLLSDDDEISFGGVRFDKYFNDESVLTFEGGTADVQGPVFQSGIGRIQLIDVKRPWARFNYNREHLNITASYTAREADKQLALASAQNVALDTERIQFEVQTNWEFGDDRFRVVAGASHTDEDIDSLDPATGRQTLMFAPVSADAQAVYAQVDIRANEKVKVVLAARWDDSTLHDSQVSPKAALVFSPSRDHTLRFTYNEAFQVANYSEFFLQASVALPVDLSAVEPICTANPDSMGMPTTPVDCGFGNGMTPVYALGNDDLELEEIKTIEFGYSGILGENSYFTVDYYSSNNENFITDLVSQIGPGGRVNPDFGPYQAPAGLTPTAEATLLGTLAAAAMMNPSLGLLTNNFDGAPILGALTYTNFGEVDTQGLDIGLNHYFNGNWSLNAAYSYFDFDIKTAGASPDQLSPNSPEHKFVLGVGYVDSRHSADLSARWVDDFFWVVGPFQGSVESYTTVDFNWNFKINDTISVGANVANLLDEEHWQSFGGDLLARRGLVNVAFHWD